MGVKGLQSFIDNNGEFTQPHKLHSCHLVVDGNNLLYHLYFHSQADYLHGGDYVRYGNYVRKYFKALLQCNIVPVVVFDGGNERDGSKLPKLMERARFRMVNSRRLARQERCTEKVLPALTRLVLNSVLQELGLVAVQSAYEADYEISAVASKLDCPVASQDSDFYIYPLPQGLIRLDTISPSSLRTEKLEDGTTRDFISCCIYHSSNFTRYFPGLDLSLLPLFGSVAGNDIIFPPKLAPFFQHIPLPKTKSRRYRYSKQHAKIIGLLEWLTNKDLEEAIEGVLRHLWKDSIEGVRNQINMSLNQYGKSNTNLLHFIKGGGDPVPESSELTSYTGKSLPDWLVARFHQNRAAAFLINALGMHKHILQSQVEDFSEPSTNACSRFVRQIIYTILLAYDYGEDLKTSNEAFVEEYDRIQTNLAKIRVAPCDISIPTNLLNVMPELDSERRKDYLISLLGVDSWVRDLPQEFALFACALSCTIRHSETKLSPPMIATILLTLFYLSLIKPLAEGNISPSSPPYDQKQSEELPLTQLYANIRKEDAQMALIELSKCDGKANHGKRLDIVPIHHQNQFQVTLGFVIYLNGLLMEPFPSGSVERMVNGPFSFNLYRRLGPRTQLKLYISQMLGSKPNWLSSFLLRIIQLFISPEDLSSCTLSQLPRRKFKACKVK